MAIPKAGVLTIALASDFFASTGAISHSVWAVIHSVFVEDTGFAGVIVSAYILRRPKYKTTVPLLS